MTFSSGGPPNRQLLATVRPNNLNFHERIICDGLKEVLGERPLAVAGNGDDASGS